MQAKNIIDTKFDWNIKKEGTIYNNIKCNEFTDIKYLNAFLNLDTGIDYRLRKGKMTKYHSERNQIANYYTNYNNKKKSFNTSHALPAHGWGRVQATDAKTLSTFHRCTRHKLCEDYYTDIDLVNAHPSFLLSFAKYHKLECSILQEYCNNPKSFRKDIIDTHMPGQEYKDVKDIVKKLPISLINAGSYNGWKKEQGLDITKSSSKILQLEIELKDIGLEIYNNNPQIAKDIIKNDKQYFKDKSKDPRRTTIALWCQTIERYLVEEAIKHVSETYKIQLADICTCQDGFMIPKKSFKPNMIKKINKHINSIYPYGVSFETKDFDEAIEIPKHSNLEQDIMDIIRVNDEINYFAFDYDEYIDLGDNKEIHLEDDDFDNADVGIIQAGTGGGKTKAVVNKIVNYLNKNADKRVLCLSSRISIVEEISKKFNIEHDMQLIDYRNCNSEDIINNNSYICVNSIDKLYDLDFENTILYIDEPTNLFMNLTRNDTMTNPKMVVATLCQMFKKCHKVILTDAHH